jgi:hypothetical protein
VVFAFVMLVNGSGLGAQAGTAFTYQGRLHNSGSAAAGLHDFEFMLFDSEQGGVQIGGTVSVNAVELTNGYFSVPLDFGNVFAGQEVWLETGVRAGGTGETFTVLSPRQPVSAAPYAQKALKDSDTLAALQCGAGQIPKRVNGQWTCANDETEGPAAVLPAVEQGVWKVEVLTAEEGRIRQVVADSAHGELFSGSLIYLDRNMVEARRIDFFDAVVVSYDAVHYESGTTTSLTEIMEFRPGRVVLGTVGATGSMILKLFSNTFSFELNGEAVTDTVRVEPGAIKFNHAASELLLEMPKLVQPNAGQAMAHPYGFTMDLPVGMDGPDSAWRTISGGQLEFVPMPKERTWFRFEDVTLNGYFSQARARRDTVDWINNWLRGRGEPVNAELVLIDIYAETVMTVSYLDAAPVLYVPPAVDASLEDPLEEKLVFRAGRIE